MEATLNSWKEIAQFLGRSVRTVQRWEQELGLPVRRPAGHDRSAVVAVPSELKAWIRRTPSQVDVSRQHATSRFARLHANSEALVETTRKLLLVARQLNDDMHKIMDARKNGKYERSKNGLR